MEHLSTLSMSVMAIDQGAELSWMTPIVEYPKNGVVKVKA